MEPEQAADFRADTMISPSGEGRWTVTVSPDWGGPPGPNGGYIAALILRAIRAEVGDAARSPRSLTIHYMRPPAHGEAEVLVTVERSGRTATTCTARMVQGGKETCLALCTFVDAYPEAVSWSSKPPQVPPPEDCRKIERKMFASVNNQLEMRPLFGGRPFSGRDDTVAGGWTRTRVPAKMEPELLALYTDVWWPPAFVRLTEPLLAPTLDLTIHFRADPPEGDTQHVLSRFESTTAVDGFVEEDGWLWDEEGRLIAQSRQHALLRPIPEGAPNPFAGAQG